MLLLLCSGVMELVEEGHLEETGGIGHTKELAYNTIYEEER